MTPEQAILAGLDDPVPTDEEIEAKMRRFWWHEMAVFEEHEVE
jgi:hypothetical protein